jgi:hypothetical protein
LLRGKLRKIEVVENRVKHTEYQASYNELGQFTRVTQDGITIDYRNGIPADVIYDNGQSLSDIITTTRKE